MNIRLISVRDCFARDAESAALRFEEPLNPTRGDLTERVVLECRTHVQSHLVSVELLGALG